MVVPFHQRYPTSLPTLFINACPNPYHVPKQLKQHNMDPYNLSPPLPRVSQEEFILFHTVDRELYRILVVSLDRDPAESMQVLAMWLWLEKVGFRNVVNKVVSLPNMLVNEAADETVTCLNYINNALLLSHSFEAGAAAADIPLLHSIVGKEITLQFLYENRVEAQEGVAKMVQDVCLRALTDIMHQATALKNTNNNNNSNNNNRNVWFGSIGPTHLSPGSGGSNDVAADERTMFVTFSKGYRVEEWEVREFFNLAYGDCIEALYMQEVDKNEQPLFARVVFRSLSSVDTILSGVTKVKFTINGKHVWIRKFVPKRTKSLISTSSSGESSSGIGI